jgi:hypothetical protein
MMIKSALFDMSLVQGVSLLTIILLPALYVHHKREYYETRLQALKNNVRVQQRVVKELMAYSQNNRHIFFGRPEPLEQHLQDKANKHRIRTDKITCLPTEVIHQDDKSSLLKTPVRLNFVVENDQNVWSFIEQLRLDSPGALKLHFVAMERAHDSQGRLRIKGVLHGDWFHVHMMRENHTP